MRLTHALSLRHCNQDNIGRQRGHGLGPWEESNVIQSSKVDQGMRRPFCFYDLKFLFASIVIQQLAQHMHSDIGAQRDTAQQYRTTPSSLILGESALSIRATAGKQKGYSRIMTCIEGGKRKE